LVFMKNLFHSTFLCCVLLSMGLHMCEGKVALDTWENQNSPL
jgi:hypothetical protein